MPQHPWTAGLARDRWLVVAAFLMLALYAALLAMRATGEGWGRGWNLVAFWLYASPSALVLAGVCAWRAVRASGAHRLWAAVVAMLVIRAKG